MWERNRDMNYIWDTIIKARKLGILEEDIRFIRASEYSPYMEMSFAALNELLKNEDVNQQIPIEINPYYRFHEIFKNFYTMELDQDKKIKDELFNWLVHLLVKVDLNHGMNLQEFLRRFMEEEIEKNSFGKELAEKWEAFEEEEKKFISNKMVELYHLAKPIYTLKEVVHFIFPDSYVYTNHLDKAELLIYAGKKKKDVYIEKMEFIKTMFLPLEYTCRIYWSNHFGIIGMPETMQLDKIALY